MEVSMSPPAMRQRRWTRRDYDRVVDAGAFWPEDRLELLDGEVWEMTPQSCRHAIAFELVAAALQKAFEGIGHVRHQLPIALDELSEPEPDVAVVPGLLRDYREEHPRQALLVVEVAETSLAHDRGRKLAAYARNQVPEYWLLDLTADRLEVYREPHGDSYESRAVLAAGDRVRPLHAPEVSIRVADLWP